MTASLTSFIDIELELDQSYIASVLTQSSIFGPFSWINPLSPIQKFFRGCTLSDKQLSSLNT